MIILALLPRGQQKVIARHPYVTTPFSTPLDPFLLPRTSSAIALTVQTVFRSIKLTTPSASLHTRQPPSAVLIAMSADASQPSPYFYPSPHYYTSSRFNPAIDSDGTALQLLELSMTGARAGASLPLFQALPIQQTNSSRPSTASTMIESPSSGLEELPTWPHVPRYHDGAYSPDKQQPKSTANVAAPMTIPNRAWGYAQPFCAEEITEPHDPYLVQSSQLVWSYPSTCDARLTSEPLTSPQFRASSWTGTSTGTVGWVLNHSGASEQPSAADTPLGKEPPDVDVKKEKANVRKHVCPICDKRFNRPSSLNTHMSVHTGAKPYVCSKLDCGRRFSVSSNLRRHERIHKPQSEGSLLLEQRHPFLQPAWQSPQLYPGEMSLAPTEFDIFHVQAPVTHTYLPVTTGFDLGQYHLISKPRNGQCHEARDGLYSSCSYDNGQGPFDLDIKPDLLLS
ncbi:hypothetical protein IAU60_005920 [Kwoniella sp. DSM 27419]